VTHDLLRPERQAPLEVKRVLGLAALDVMERYLASRADFVGERYSMADIALYAYTHVADEGGFDLGPCPAVRAWCVRAQSSHIPIAQG